MEKRVFFMSGFPRAGTTLLQNILSQNPLLFPTPTSGLIGTLLEIRNKWRDNEIYRSSGEEYVYPKIKTMLKNLILGFYENEINNGLIPIDKNRSWVGYFDLLDEIFGYKVKFIYPIRHIMDCTISMENVNRKSSIIFHGDNGNRINEKFTIGRAENFLKDDGIMGSTLLNLREIIYRKEIDRLILVPYNDLLILPDETINNIYNKLEIPIFKHDFNNIKQNIVEYDTNHGFAPNSLHKIKEGNLTQPKPRNYNIFNKEYCNIIEKERFKDITDFINFYSKIKDII